jgi:conserved phage C-terminus (phg_2220_C)
MVIAWTGTEWEQYLRPRTLFSNKFEDYLRWKNNKNITKKTANNNDFIVTEESLAETFGRYK